MNNVLLYLKNVKILLLLFIMKVLILTKPWFWKTTREKTKKQNLTNKEKLDRNV